MSNKKNQNANGNASPKSESGFTLVEAVCAIFLLTIALIGTAAAITYALEFGAISRNVTSAKSVIVSSIEEIETLRNARRLEFKQIANVGAVNNVNVKNPFNGFSTGFKLVALNPGEDGVNGTNDDLIDAGADGDFGTPDDFENQALVRQGYQRQITITSLSDSLKRIEIKVQYVGRAGKMGEITGVSYLNDEARVTR